MTLAAVIVAGVVVLGVCAVLLRRVARTVTVATLALLAALIGYYVWPTPYRFYAATGDFGGIIGYRESRLSGSVDVLARRGWMPIANVDTTPGSAGSRGQHARVDSADLLAAFEHDRHRSQDSSTRTRQQP